MPEKIMMTHPAAMTTAVAFMAAACFELEGSNRLITVCVEMR